MAITNNAPSRVTTQIMSVCP